MVSLQTINVYTANSEVFPVIEAVQNDSARAVKCLIQDFTIPTGSTVTLWCQRPTGTH